MRSEEAAEPSAPENGASASIAKKDWKKQYLTSLILLFRNETRVGERLKGDCRVFWIERN
jgi:hypothetical protein